MTVTSSTVNNHLVYHDSAKSWRWFDAIGPNVTQWELNPNMFPLASSTTVSGHTVTNVSGTLVLAAGADGGAVVFTPAGSDNDGIQIQPTTEAFSFASKWPCYFGVKLEASDVTQSDMLVGLTITDTTAATAVSDGIYFTSVDASAVLTAASIQTGGTSSATAATLVDATPILLEFFYDGSNLTYYVNGSAVTTLADSAASFPDDEYLAPMLAWLTGEGEVNTMTVYWARAIQIREAI